MAQVEKRLKKFGMASLALLELALDIVDDATGLTAFEGKKGLWTFAKKMNMGEYQLKTAIRNLELNEFIERSEEKFYITPKGRKRAKELEIEKPSRDIRVEDWDKKWKIVIFDIPESQKSDRNLFRSILKRKGFVRLQNSVFVAPEANFEELDVFRRKYQIDKYVNFLVAESNKLDDDTLLRKKFGLLE